MEEIDNSITYSKAIAELDEIVAKMQDQACDIDHLSQYTARALQLLKVCKSKLTSTDEELNKILAALDESGGNA